MSFYFHHSNCSEQIELFCDRWPKIVLKESSLDLYFTRLTNSFIIISLLQSQVKCSSNQDLRFQSGISVENSKKKIELAIKQYNVSYMSI